MKICLVSDQYAGHINDMKADEISGIALHTGNLVDGLLKENHEVTLICNQKQDVHPEDFRYIYFPCPWLDFTPKKWLSFSIGLSKKIHSLQEKYKFDIFHSLDAKQGALAAAKLSIPTIGNINDYYAAMFSLSPVEFLNEYPGDWFKRYLYHVVTRTFERKYFNNFKILVANSNATRRYVGGGYSIPENKFLLIHKALPYFPDKKNPVMEKSDGRFTILLVGSNLQRKGIYYLIDSAPQVLKEFPGATFEIVGKTQLPMIEKCRLLKVDDNFKFHGSLNHRLIDDLYRKADIFVMPSLIEGFGMSVVEAMSYGLPAVASKGTGIDDIVDDGINGFLVHPRSVGLIAGKIIKLLKDPALRQRMSENAFKKARVFNKETQLKETLELYNNALKSGGPKN
ncbi:MAG: glycosyltransferase family 4 protein [Elusimicrobia bacterium]|nr:glycosyltransferase family 4 protein [Candidatus Liberimonas magnetica]